MGNPRVILGNPQLPRRGEVRWGLWWGLPRITRGEARWGLWRGLPKRQKSGSKSSKNCLKLTEIQHFNQFKTLLLFINEFFLTVTIFFLTFLGLFRTFFELLRIWELFHHVDCHHLVAIILHLCLSWQLLLYNRYIRVHVKQLRHKFLLWCTRYYSAQ